MRKSKWIIYIPKDRLVKNEQQNVFKQTTTYSDLNANFWKDSLISGLMEKP